MDESTDPRLCLECRLEHVDARDEPHSCAVCELVHEHGWQYEQRYVQRFRNAQFDVLQRFPEFRQALVDLDASLSAELPRPELAEDAELSMRLHGFVAT